ncbi:hypothetical protein DOT_0437 [Desulfosporosinus sp. OT]|nr:hypothetical protein DOT_0437 [Desulfosporosinus sp. OT]
MIPGKNFSGIISSLNERKVGTGLNRYLFLYCQKVQLR